MTITEALNIFDLADAPADDVIKRRYRDVAKVVHPDRNSGNEATATRLIKHYNNAQDLLLSTPQQLRVRGSNRSRSRPGSGAGAQRGAGGPRGSDTSTHEDLREQIENVAAFSQWLAGEIPKGRVAQLLFGGTALLALGSLVYKVVEDSRV